MSELENTKKQEINSMVAILLQLDLDGIRLINRDANTLLALKEEKERENRLGQDERRLA